MWIRSRRTLLLSVLLGAVSFNGWTHPADPGAAPGDRKQALDRFIAKKKFVKEPGYPVALSEADRLRYEAWVNQLARSLRQLPPSRQTKAVVLERFKPVMKKFDSTEGEDQDRLLWYLEELMDIYGIERSDGMLSTWRHGVDTTKWMEARDAQVQERNAQAVAAMNTEERAWLERFQTLTKANAEHSLRSLWGTPDVEIEAEGFKGWSSTTADGFSTVGLSARGPAVVLIWRFRGFTYVRRF